ncbi:MAG: nucleoside triphosphate pyrophosphohydrolase [Oscillospiraceae bacterium]|jgi:tetrapyrrole methylase family protein/MazG family protein|nr:nucleoside triphosphate pyrophosphohydrolase [Oscillospiraceae bacterium]
MIEIKQNYTLPDLLAIMSLLRSENGCPWDIEQTHASIRMNVIEEAYEVAEAIDSGDNALLKEELGDLLLQIVFHAQIADESGEYNFDGICDGICKKLIYRHPHVFGKLSVGSTGEVLRNWDNLKSKSKGEERSSDSLENVPHALPALMRGEKVGKRAAGAGFDFCDVNEVIARLKEELQELEFAVINKNNDEIEDEFGDILFTCCNLGRFLKKDSEKALTRAINKFIMRFRAVESLAEEKGKTFAEIPQQELNELWEAAKHNKNFGG